MKVLGGWIGWLGRHMDASLTPHTDFLWFDAVMLLLVFGFAGGMMWIGLNAIADTDDERLGW